MKKRFYHMLLCLTLLLASCTLLAVGANAADPMRDFDFARYASMPATTRTFCGPMGQISAKMSCTCTI